MANLVVSALGAIAQHLKSGFIRSTQNIEATQTQFLQTLLQTHQDTAFGQDYGLRGVKTIRQFQERVPIQPYAAFAPYTQRMAEGEKNILVSDPLIYFNISSGSTGQKKLIPVTKRSRSFLSRANRIALGFVLDAIRRENRSLGKVLFPISVNPLGQTPSGIAYAPVSTSDLKLTDWFGRQVFVNPFEAFQIADTTARFYVCLLFALRDAKLGVIGATFPVLALQLCDYLEQYGESLVQDLRSGTLASWLKLAPHLRPKLERSLSPSPKRAAQLGEVLKRDGRLTPRSAWPHLSFVSTARGGTSNFYFQRFPEYFGNVPIFGGIYSCAEGMLGIHYDFDKDAVIPALGSGFLEFIPEDQWEVDCPKALLPWEVTSGQRYRVVLTNYSGFYRYDLGDIVQVDGFYEQAPLIRFLHRRGGVISSSTEKTTEAHVIEVMERLQRMFGITLANFCITLSTDATPPHYLVNIELAPGSSLAEPEAFLQGFDDTMKVVQHFYAMKRGDQIPVPRLRILAPGSFETLRQRMLRSGRPEAQIKFPHVTDDRQWLDDLVVSQEIRMAGDRPLVEVFR